MRILIAGHWEPDTITALEEIAEGIRQRRPQAVPAVMPFGKGEVFAYTLAVQQPDSTVITIADTPDGGARAGEHLREALSVNNSETTIFVEGSHQDNIDGGRTFLQALTGINIPMDAESGYQEFLTQFKAALNQARIMLSGKKIIGVASTTRALSGLNSALAVTTDLVPRNGIDPQWVAALADVYRHGIAQSLLDNDASKPATLPGSGAGGGVMAALHSVGVPVMATGPVLTAHCDVVSKLEGVNLLVVVEPELHTPVLAESVIDELTQVAAEAAIPVVAICGQSTISRHERALWNIHGVIEAGEREALRNVGERLAHTWLREM